MERTEVVHHKRSRRPSTLTQRSDSLMQSQTNAKKKLKNYIPEPADLTEDVKCLSMAAWLEEDWTSMVCSGGSQKKKHPLLYKKNMETNGTRVGLFGHSAQCRADDLPLFCNPRTCVPYSLLSKPEYSWGKHKAICLTAKAWTVNKQYFRTNGLHFCSIKNNQMIFLCFYMWTFKGVN